MRAEKLKIIKNVLGRGYQSGEEHLFSCPFCGHHKKKMSVNVDKSVFKCWICDKSGRDLGYIVRKFGTREDRGNRDSERRKTATIFYGGRQCTGREVARPKLRRAPFVNLCIR